MYMVKDLHEICSLNKITYKNKNLSKNALKAIISEHVLDHQSNSNFKLLLKKGIAIDEEELWEKKKDNIDDSLEEGEIENNNDNNNQKEENNNDAASSYSSSSNSPTSNTESEESFKDTSKKTHGHLDGMGLPPKSHPRKKCSGSNSKRIVSAPSFTSTKRSTRSQTNTGSKGTNSIVIEETDKKIAQLTTDKHSDVHLPKVLDTSIIHSP